jgi:hypothetical protein
MEFVSETNKVSKQFALVGNKASFQTSNMLTWFYIKQNRVYENREIKALGVLW